MLTGALLCSAVAVLFGSWLAALHARATASPPGWVRLVHGAAGGFAVAGLLLAGASRGWQFQAIAWDALGLLAAALLMGAAYLLARERLGAQRGMVLFVHGALGVTGAALLAGWVL